MVARTGIQAGATRVKVTVPSCFTYFTQICTENCLVIDGLTKIICEDHTEETETGEVYNWMIFI